MKLEEFLNIEVGDVVEIADLETLKQEKEKSCNTVTVCVTQQMASNHYAGKQFVVKSKHGDFGYYKEQIDNGVQIDASLTYSLSHEVPCIKIVDDDSAGGWVWSYNLISRVVTKGGLHKIKDKIQVGSIVRIKGKFHSVLCKYSDNYYGIPRGVDVKVIEVYNPNDVTDVKVEYWECARRYTANVLLQDIVTEDDFDNHDYFGLELDTGYVPEEEMGEYNRCDDCGEIYRNSDLTLLNNGDYVCDSCMSSGDYFTCDDCGETFRGEGYWHDDCVYCEDCYNARFADDDYYTEIKDYHDRPVTHFYGDDGGFETDGNGFKGYGFELEVDNGGDYDSIACDVMNKLDREVYCQHDGSIDYGFEIISHPHTEKALYNMRDRLDDVMEYLVDQDYRSHDAKTCGLHLHASRTLFGKNEKMQRIAISKIIIFYDMFWNDILRVSRRTRSQAEEWADRYSTANMTPKQLRENLPSSRYMAVNLNNRDTVEFRLMRGTLNKKTFWATIDFLITTIKNSTKITYKDITKPEKWLDGIKPETAEYIRSRGAFASVVGDREVQQPVEEIDQNENVDTEQEEDDE